MRIAFAEKLLNTNDLGSIRTHGCSVCHRTTNICDDRPSTSSNHYDMIIWESVDQFGFSSVPPVCCIEKCLSAHGKALQVTQTTTESLQTSVAAIHFKPTVDKYSRIWEHARIQSTNTLRTIRSWSEVARI